jgi:hypothetical protein
MVLIKDIFIFKDVVLYLSILLHSYTLHTIILFPSQCNVEKLILTLSVGTTHSESSTSQAHHYVGCLVYVETTAY